MGPNPLGTGRTPFFSRLESSPHQKKLSTGYTVLVYSTAHSYWGMAGIRSVFREEPPDRDLPPIVIEEAKEDFGDGNEEQSTTILPSEYCLLLNPAQISNERDAMGFQIQMAAHE